ncbi:DUF6152 family protein [Ideonella sp. A 288]|uniref:DUF6152 family protein n=1 Tax=Ideonella sp. A 288 TaxID=1962181 RepID=UPI000B4B92A2|nr:DUF6152 family protein [Ideonella sp. A 288]
MQRRHLLIAAATLPAPVAFAHHGWSSFDQSRPLYLEGMARKVAWRNPHAEFDLEVAADLKLPADLARRTLPAQSAGVDGPALLANARLPTRRDKVWHIELAPLTRMEAWKVAEIKPGDRVALLGFTFNGEKGEPVLRVEYLFIGAATYGLRSSPT